MVKKVLLFANVFGKSSGFYHVGDEAMYYQTFQSYKKYQKDIQCVVIAGTCGTSDTTTSTYNHLDWPNDPSRARSYFFKLLVKSFVYIYCNLNTFSQEQLSFVQSVKNVDIIHFTGGGNITSLYASWMYYSYFLLGLGWLLRKTSVLSSQTIGPLRGFDRWCSLLFLNIPQKIYIRESWNDVHPLLKYGVIFPKVSSQIDAAYLLSSTTYISLPKKKAAVRVGISIFNWHRYGKRMRLLIIGSINVLASTMSVEVVLIPHILTKMNAEWDQSFMKNMVKYFAPTVTVHSFSDSQLMGSAREPATTIKYLTSQVDVLLTARYHGVIFALSQDIPSITLVGGEYYRQKIVGALRLTYGDSSNTSRYIIDLEHTPDVRHLSVQLFSLISHLKTERFKLKQANKQLVVSGRLDPLSRLV